MIVCATRRCLVCGCTCVLFGRVYPCIWSSNVWRSSLGNVTVGASIEVLSADMPPSRTYNDSEQGEHELDPLESRSISADVIIYHSMIIQSYSTPQPDDVTSILNPMILPLNLMFLPSIR
jgi:hypothetical protein